MNRHINKTRLLVICLVASVLVHLLPLYALRLFGTYHFAGPVSPEQVVVDLSQAPPPDTENDTDGEEPETSSNNAPDESSNDKDAHEDSPSSPDPEQPQPVAKTPTPAISGEKAPESKTKTTEPAKSSVSPDPRKVDPKQAIGPVATILASISPTSYEKLTYQVSIYGLPIGEAELEAKNENGETWLTLRVKSNAAISNVFPVDNTIVTRHIDNRYIMTTIKQHEGSFVNDEGFTINLKRKRVIWYNNINNRNQTFIVPTEEVIDTLSGIYFLRNRQLQIGKNEILHIFDSETYAEVPVEILRREKIRLPNLTEIDTLVVRPIQKTAGIFRRTGDILIWMTDDANKVPVKIVTSIALGTVTADLISAESKLPEKTVIDIKK